jgi:hypothetical protein
LLHNLFYFTQNAVYFIIVFFCSNNAFFTHCSKNQWFKGYVVSTAETCSKVLRVKYLCLIMHFIFKWYQTRTCLIVVFFQFCFRICYWEDSRIVEGIETEFDTVYGLCWCYWTETNKIRIKQTSQTPVGTLV